MAEPSCHTAGCARATSPTRSSEESLAGDVPGQRRDQRLVDPPPGAPAEEGGEPDAELTAEPEARRARRPADRSFLLQVVQPGLTGLIDGSLSTLAPIFAIAVATHRPHYAFLAGVATAIGAGVSMAFSEGLSDTGELTGRGSPFRRGAITGVGTFTGGVLHTLPFLIPEYKVR